MGFDYYEVLPEQVDSAGRAEASEGTDWEAWSSDVRTLIQDAVDSVLDGPINLALVAKGGDLNQAAGRLVSDVVADGENIATGASTVVAGEEEMVNALTPTLLWSEAVLASVRTPI
jgi:hypothetical protein